MIHIKKITTEEAYPIRLEVLRKNIPLPYKFNGDFDMDTFHLGAFKNEKLIAVSSFMKASNNELKEYDIQYQLRGMATLNEFQGIGAGKLMMESAYKMLSDLNVSCLWCNARVIAVPFYENLGMSIYGKPFELQYIGLHYTMYKALIPTIA